MPPPFFFLHFSYIMVIPVLVYWLGAERSVGGKHEGELGGLWTICIFVFGTFLYYERKCSRIQKSLCMHAVRGQKFLQLGNGTRRLLKTLIHVVYVMYI